jgi:hypothetical protein
VNSVTSLQSHEPRLNSAPRVGEGKQDDSQVWQYYRSIQHWFVSGHGFSRAVQVQSRMGLSAPAA